MPDVGRAKLRNDVPRVTSDLEKRRKGKRERKKEKGRRRKEMGGRREALLPPTITAGGGKAGKARWGDELRFPGRQERP